MDSPVQVSEDEWKNKLTPEQFHVLRERGTELPFTGKYFKHNEEGTYTCAGCGAELFNSNHKYESDMPGLAGWPSFADVVKSNAIKLSDDNRLGMNRIEVSCSKCGGHLGHLFDDQSAPTGKHYCINSCALDFKPGK